MTENQIRTLVKMRAKKREIMRQLLDLVKLESTLTSETINGRNAIEEIRSCLVSVTKELRLLEDAVIRMAGAEEVVR